MNDDLEKMTQRAKHSSERVKRYVKEALLPKIRQAGDAAGIWLERLEANFHKLKPEGYMEGFTAEDFNDLYFVLTGQKKRVRHGATSFESQVEKDDRGFADVSFRVRGDALSSLLRFLRHCQYNGQIGHSYQIVADPDNSDNRATFGFDGDGSDKIEDIKVNGVSLPKDYKWKRAARIARIAERIFRR